MFLRRNPSGGYIRHVIASGFAARAGSGGGRTSGVAIGHSFQTVCTYFQVLTIEAGGVNHFSRYRAWLSLAVYLPPFSSNKN